MSDSIDDLLQNLDIIEIIEQYAPLRKYGSEVVGLCPFHYDKKPTLKVDSFSQRFHCLQCKSEGNVVDFVAKATEQSIEKTIESLHAKVTEKTAKKVKFSQELNVDQMYEAHDLLAKLYHYLLTSTPKGKAALKYLLNRGLKLETIKEFQIGYAPKEWEFTTGFLTNRNFDLPTMVDAGLLSMKKETNRIYDRFRGRIMFPIHDENGRVIAFGGRAMDNETNPKYLNSPDTPIFLKGETVYNIHRAKEHVTDNEPFTLYEGYMDVISAWQAGYRTGVATLGTSITIHQAKKIQSYNGVSIICYDGDKAGQDATNKAIDYMTKVGSDVSVAPMPNDIDPDEYIKTYGAKQYGEYVLQRNMSVASYHVDRLKSYYDLTQIDEFMQYATAALEVIHSVGDEKEKRKMALQIAQETVISPDALHNHFIKIPL